MLFAGIVEADLVLKFVAKRIFCGAELKHLCFFFCGRRRQAGTQSSGEIVCLVCYKK